VLLVAERAALLAGRDDEFTTLVTIGYTGMRWGETIGLERYLLLSALINVEWQLREVSGRFHRLPPKDDSLPQHERRAADPGRHPAPLTALLAARQASTHGSSAPAPPSRCLCHGGPRPLSPPAAATGPQPHATSPMLRRDQPADERSRQARTMLLVL
jgi:hypothetical protein